MALRYLFTVVMGVMVFGGFSDNPEAKAAAPDDSDSVMISGGGIFYPFQDKSGFNGIGIPSSQERLGVELGYRKYETELFNAKHIDT